MARQKKEVSEMREVAGKKLLVTVPEDTYKRLKLVQVLKEVNLSQFVAEAIDAHCQKFLQGNDSDFAKLFGKN